MTQFVESLHKLTVMLDPVAQTELGEVTHHFFHHHVNFLLLLKWPVLYEMLEFFCGVEGYPKKLGKQKIGGNRITNIPIAMM